MILVGAKMRVGAEIWGQVETDVSQDCGMKHFYTVDILASQPIKRLDET